ncbi:MAG: type II secretion system GspH family protein [Rickettsiales bacterium]|nr:type II secretion system GspH family protein [Rickettsiales bacterium]
MLKSKKRAFTLIELSIVLIVLGIITVGVLKGTGLISSSKIGVARSLTARSVVQNIDGLVAWYESTSFDSFDASDVSDGHKINNWYDISPASIPQKSNRNKLAAKTGNVTYVKKGINEVPSLQFSSSGGSVTNLQLSSFYQGSTAQNTVFIVFQQNARTYVSSYDRWIIDSYSSASTTSFGYSDVSGVDDIRLNGGSTTIATGSTDAPSFIDGKSYIAAIYYDGTYSKAYLNNTATTVGAGYLGSGVTNPGSNSLTGLTVGSLKDDTSASRFVGLISEIIIYNRVLKDLERKDVFRYLAKKYNIAVSGI